MLLCFVFVSISFLICHEDVGTEKDTQNSGTITEASKTANDEDSADKMKDTDSVFTAEEESADQLQRLHSIPEAEFFFGGMHRSL